MMRWRISGKITGLTPGKHAFHVHQYGDLTDIQPGEIGGRSLQSHAQPHGQPTAEHRHAGDFGNILADEHGVATIDFEDHVVKLDGPTSVIGRSLVVHPGMTNSRSRRAMRARAAMG